MLNSKFVTSEFDLLKTDVSMSSLSSYPNFFWEYLYETEFHELRHVFYINQIKTLIRLLQSNSTFALMFSSETKIVL